jgi:hypothetical protein
MAAIVFIVILAIILILSRRKMGYFNLVILAGVVLNRYWNKDLTVFLTTSNLAIPESTLSGIIGILLILVSALLILMKNPKQEKLILGLFSSIFSSIFAYVVSISYFEKVFLPDLLSKSISVFFEQWASWIILIGVILSILSITSFKFKKIEKTS